MSSSTEEELLMAAAATCSIVLLNSSSMEAKNFGKKRKWIKEWRKYLATKSSFDFLQNELRLVDKPCYKNFLRMDETAFEKLLTYIEEDLTKKDTCMRKAIPVREKLAATLRFLATGETYQSLEYQTKLSDEFLCKNIPQICSTIYNKLKQEYLKFPSSQYEWTKIAEKLAIRWQFPLCVGALDGRHIAFTARKTDGAFYRNYKGFNSIVLMLLVDADCKIIYCDIGCNGRVSDGGVLRRSALMTIIENAENYFPPEQIIGNDRKLPYVIVGDDAFPLQKHIMKPYPFKSPEPEKQIFNARLSRARHTVEHTFGILANRFRVLQTTMKLSVKAVEIVVQACCVLHNFLIDSATGYDRIDEENSTTLSGDTGEEVSGNLLTLNNREILRAAENIRGEFRSYFSNEGAVPWINEKIHG